MVCDTPGTLFKKVVQLNDGRTIEFKEVETCIHDKDGDVRTTVLGWDIMKDGVAYAHGCAPNYRPVEKAVEQVVWHYQEENSGSF